MPKFIFVTGGVVSSLGKGITAASLGRLLKSRGLKVVVQKFDPYINVDPGLMSPYQHGEVFVTDDGTEADLDLGHYERFIDQNLTGNSSVTTGKIYWSVLTKERQGCFNGGTVQVIPHITNEIKSRIHRLIEEGQPDVVITEIGGTVGDIESLPYLEAIRQLKGDVGRGNVIYIHVTLVPYLKIAGELKTKPTQHSVKELRSIGIQPDVIICRSESDLPRELKDKIALFCDIDPEAVVLAKDAETPYEIPLILEQEGLGDLVVERLGLKCGPPDLRNWEEIVRKLKNPQKKLKIALVGKYTELPDAYLSVVEALQHAGIAHDTAVDLKWIDAENLTERGALSVLNDVKGILVPGGFGYRGAEGKIEAVRYARKNRIPFFGICLGMYCAVIEFARGVLGYTQANSPEFDPETPHPVVTLLPGQENWEQEGIKNRVGANECRIYPDSLVFQAYGTEKIHERHRHRYQVNNSYLARLAEHGLVVTGTDESGEIVETMELRDHPWFVTCLFNPEFKSRPNRPHPLMRDFIGASLANE